MTISPLAPRRAPSAQKLELAQRAVTRARRYQGEQVQGRLVDVSPGLAPLLPDGALRAGGTYCVRGSTTLAAGLLSGPSSAGLWCGVVGMPQFAATGAQGVGCDLDRLVFVPHPGLDWVNVTASLADALSIVVVRPSGRVSDAEAARLSARLRQRESVLLVCGPWPRADLTLTLREGRWQGVGAGHGHLTSRRAVVEVRGRGAVGSSTEVWLPDALGDVRVLDALEHQPGDIATFEPMQQAVG